MTAPRSATLSRCCRLCEARRRLETGGGPRGFARHLIRPLWDPEREACTHYGRSVTAKARTARLAGAEWGWQPGARVPLHSTGAASGPTALLLGRIRPVCFLGAPCWPGASPVSVRRGISLRTAGSPRSRRPGARQCAPGEERRRASGPCEQRAGVWGRAPREQGSGRSPVSEGGPRRQGEKARPGARQCARRGRGVGLSGSPRSARGGSGRSPV